MEQVLSHGALGLLDPDGAALRSLGDNLPDSAIYQAMAQGSAGPSRFVYFSAGIERLLGVTPADAVGDARHVYRLVHPEDRARLRDAELHSRSTFMPFDLEFRMHTRSGELVWVHCRSMPRKGRESMMFWDGVIADVSAAKRTEEQLRQQNSELAAALERVRQLEGLVRMCAWTQRLELDGRWVSVETFLAERFGLTVTHSISSEALRALREELAERQGAADE
jgi:PAS domain S-box-containing protein